MNTINDLVKFAMENEGKVFDMEILPNGNVAVVTGRTFIETKIKGSDMPLKKWFGEDGEVAENSGSEIGIKKTVIQFDGRNAGDRGLLRFKCGM
jgi:hypothetical protein